MTLQDTVERISRKLESKGITSDPQIIEAKLKRYINEFSVPLTEAERSVMNEFARDYGIDNVISGPSETKKITDLKAGDWATIEGVVLAPSAFSKTFGVPASITATAEKVVPRSIPMILDINLG